MSVAASVLEWQIDQTETPEWEVVLSERAFNANLEAEIESAQKLLELQDNWYGSGARG